MAIFLLLRCCLDWILLLEDLFYCTGRNHQWFCIDPNFERILCQYVKIRPISPISYNLIINISSLQRLLISQHSNIPLQSRIGNIRKIGLQLIQIDTAIEIR